MTKFKPGDKIKMKEGCVGQPKGKTYTIWEDTDGELFAKNCSCQYKWHLTKPKKTPKPKVCKHKWQVTTMPIYKTNLYGAEFLVKYVLIAVCTKCFEKKYI